MNPRSGYIEIVLSSMKFLNQISPTYEWHSDMRYKIWQLIYLHKTRLLIKSTVLALKIVYLQTLIDCEKMHLNSIICLFIKMKIIQFHVVMSHSMDSLILFQFSIPWFFLTASLLRGSSRYFVVISTLLKFFSTL